MKRDRKKYDFAFKEKAVLLSYERSNTSLAKLEKELGLYPAALSSWRREYEKFNAEESLENNYLKLNLERQRIQELEKKIEKDDLEFAILKNVSQYLYQGKLMNFYYMASNEKTYSIRLMCKVLGESRNTYRAWKNQIITEKQKRKTVIQKQITDIFFAFKQRYGCRRITVELNNAGYQISSSTVYEYMKELGLINKKN